MTKIITKGNRAVVIKVQEGGVWAYLCVNARNGIGDADVTCFTWSGRTLKGAERWAAKQLGA